MSDEIKRRGPKPGWKKLQQDAAAKVAPAPEAPAEHVAECAQEADAAVEGYVMTFRCAQCKYEHTETGLVYHKTYCAKCDWAMGMVDKKKAD